MEICESCGSQNVPGALFCAHCGKPLNRASDLPSARDIANEPPLSVATVNGGAISYSPQPASDGNAVTWPFAQTNWFGSVWILLLGWIPLFGWIAALTTSTGWMVDAIGRRGRG